MKKGKQKNVIPTKERIEKGDFSRKHGRLSDRNQIGAITKMYIDKKLGTPSTALARLAAAMRFARDYMCSEFFPIKAYQLKEYMERRSFKNDGGMIERIGANDIVIAVGKKLGDNLTSLLKALLFDYPSLNSFFDANRILNKSEDTYLYYYRLVQKALDFLIDFYKTLDHGRYD